MFEQLSVAAAHRRPEPSPEDKPQARPSEEGKGIMMDTKIAVAAVEVGDETSKANGRGTPGLGTGVSGGVASGGKQPRYCEEKEGQATTWGLAERRRIEARCRQLQKYEGTEACRRSAFLLDAVRRLRNSCPLLQKNSSCKPCGIIRRELLHLNPSPRKSKPW